jgi:hypothetical protein
LNWEKKIVYVREDAEGRPWYVLLVGPNIWMRTGRFSTRAGAEAFRPRELSPWLGETAEEAGSRRRAVAAAPLY